MAGGVHRDEGAFASVFGSARERALWAQWIVCALVVAVIICLAGPVYGAAAFLALPLVVFLLLGPSQYILALFIAFLATSQEFYSFFVLPLGGVEWHPRELILFLLAAHWLLKLAAGRARFTADPTHALVGLALVFYLQIAVVGLARDLDLHRIVAELRFAVFLLAYFPLVSLIQNPEDVRYYARLVLALAVVTAVAASVFFWYALARGLTMNVQNALGVFVNREFGGVRFVLVRPMGHMMYDACVVTLMSLLFCPDTPRRRKVLYVALLALLAFAILIMVMRTALISVALSLGLLLLLSVRRRVAVGLMAGGGVAALLALALFAEPLQAFIAGIAPSIDLSLKARFVEISGALNEFQAHPLVGSGMGSVFRELGLATKTSTLAYAQTEYQTVHNIWLYYLFKGGIVGFALMAAALIGLFVRGWGLIECIPDANDRYFLRGLVATYGGQLLASLAMPRLYYPSGQVFVAMAATVFCIYAQKPRPQYPPPSQPRRSSPRKSPSGGVPGASLHQRAVHLARGRHQRTQPALDRVQAPV